MAGRRRVASARLRSIPPPPRSGETRCRCQLRRAVLACHVSSLRSSRVRVFVSVSAAARCPFPGPSNFAKKPRERDDDRLHLVVQLLSHCVTTYMPERNYALSPRSGSYFCPNYLFKQYCGILWKDRHALL